MVRSALLLLMVIISVANGFPKPNVHYLSNGAIAVTVADPSSKISSLYVFVRTGSIFEDEVIGSGASHYLEHLLAGGTTRFKDEKEYRKIIDELGGAYNAYTSYNHTAYYIHTSSNNALRALQTLYEWTVYGDWTTTEFQRENGVIKKEMERAKSNVDRQIYQNAQQLFYQTSPYEYPILGHEDIFDKLTDNDLRRYYKTRYVPENMVIVVGGDISRNVIINFIEETFGKEPYRPRKPQYKGGEHRILSKSKVAIVLPELKTKRLMLRYPTVSFYNNDVYPLDLLAYILGNGQQSVLYQEFVVRRKLATKVSVRSITPSNEYGYFEIFLETNQPSEDVVNAVQSFIETLKVMGFNKQQINAAKKQKKNEYVLSNTSMDYYLREIGQSMMMGNNPLFFSVYADNFNNVSNLMLKESMKTYLIDSKCQEYEFVSQQPTENNALNVDKNDIVMDHYKSGIDIMYIPDNNTEIVSVIVQIEGGLINETKRTNGLGYFSSKLLGKSSQFISRNKYQRIFESKGAKVGSKFSHNALTYSLKATQDDSQELMPYFFKGISQFNVEKTVFEEVKSQVVQSIERKSEDWFDESFDKFKQAIIPSSSIFSLPLEGTVQSISNIDPQMVRGYMERQLKESKINVVIHGKNPTQYKPMIEKELKRVLQRESFIDNKSLLEIVKGDVDESESIAQNTGVVMAATPVYNINKLKPYILFQLIDAALSGMRYPSGLLHTRLRGEKLVYVVHALPMQFIDQDFLFIYALTSPDRVRKVKGIIQQSIIDLKNDLSTEQFELAKSQVLFNMQNRMQDLNSKSKEVIHQMNRFGRMISIDEFESVLAEITFNDLELMVNTVFDNDAYYVVFNSTQVEENETE